MRPRKRELAASPAEGTRSEMETPPSALEEVSKISHKREVDPHLRPFIVSMANAIIKDMLRKQKERK